MVFDTHTHVPRFRERAPDVVPVANRAPGRPDKPVRWGVTWKDYIRDMGPVQKAIVCLIAGDPLAPKMGEATRSTAREANNETAEFVRTYPDRLVGFLTVHPRDPQCLEEIERATGDLGLKGIKLAPNYQNFDPRGEEAFRIFNRAQELRLPILLHQGTSPDAFADLDYAHPRHLDRVATAFPDLRMIIAHMAHPWQADAIVVARKHPNVFIDVSALFYRPWSHYNCMRLATEWSVLHKLFFATDYPVATAEETMEGMRRVNDILEGTRLPRVPEEAIEAIINRDSLSLLSLA